MSIFGVNPLDIFTRPFEVPEEHVAYLSDNEDEDLSLRQFKDVVMSWSVRILGRRVLVTHKEVIEDGYYPLHVNIHIVAIKFYKSKYILLCLVFNQRDDNKAEFHFGLDIEIGEGCGPQFNIAEFVDGLRKQNHSLLKRWEGLPAKWHSNSAIDVGRRLSTMVIFISKSSTKKRRQEKFDIMACSSLNEQSTPLAPASRSMQVL